MQTPRFQRGAVLFTALMFLIVVTLVALASIRSGVLELRMSLNDELSVSAFQQAQALADWVAAN
ncbi:MAG: PilX N-terminal domain-containing pilus assembly protein, partial [Gammaproteobacteria bacterium]